MNFEFTGVLLRSAGNRSSVPIPAATLGDALTELTSQLPQMGRILLDNTGQLRRAHRLFLNGELVPNPDRTMVLSESDRIEFLTAIAGG
ncbi:MAG TPA: MoaD/ThiS family protein [Actinophytocola sp.]|jgi:molybdopterin converting factor small subunit|uniref:MoaD/ThiS family protein n=1 Tax=Actinophytocola sp. TaxID=1872138 RepID=UPI002E06263B|nr:MoaD/ThiS family protein [Actinophytocola sp.]